jgi:hypothetical protein
LVDTKDAAGAFTIWYVGIFGSLDGCFLCVLFVVLVFCCGAVIHNCSTPAKETNATNDIDGKLPPRKQKIPAHTR